MRHSFEIQKIRVNPKQRKYFDSTPNEDRTQKELQEYWDKPYIIIDELQQKSWIEHKIRLQEMGWDAEKIGSKEAFQERQKESRLDWTKNWGVHRYSVRCLDGGAWDRSTNHGCYRTFEEALQVAKGLL